MYMMCYNVETNFNNRWGDKMKEPYYMAYEKRYQTVFSAGAKCWGHTPNDDVLYNTLKTWVGQKEKENTPKQEKSARSY